MTSEAKERVRQLERENAELKRANEIFARGIDFLTRRSWISQPGTKRNK